MTVSAPLGKALAFTIGYQIPGSYGEEGGEADNPSDPGGFTWRGITLDAYRAWQGNYQLTSTDLLKITEAQIVAFYASQYWNKVCGDQLPAGVSLSVFDMAVNAGDYASATILQSLLKTMVDGYIGPLTIAAVDNEDHRKLICDLATAQLSYYKTRSDWADFGSDWSGRVQRRQAAALAML